MSGASGRLHSPLGLVFAGVLGITLLMPATAQVQQKDPLDEAIEATKAEIEKLDKIRIQVVAMLGTEHDIRKEMLNWAKIYTAILQRLHTPPSTPAPGPGSAPDFGRVETRTLVPYEPTPVQALDSVNRALSEAYNRLDRLYMEKARKKGP